MKNRKWTRKLLALLVVGALVLTATSCSTSDDSAQASESELQQDNYEKQVATEPAHTMPYPMTRVGINGWIDTWGQEPGKLSYVYMMASNGQLIGYYILKGLPISYCALLTPDYEIVEKDDSELVVKAPSIDGVYYSGGQCNQYYGFDASTGSYMEFSIGDGINYMLFEEPLARQDVEPLGFTTVEEAASLDAGGN